MTTKTITRTTTTREMRRCTGSARFGIEAHEAPVSDFPKQPSQKDGLGRMCTEHWRIYTSGLRKDAQASAKDATTPTPETSRRTKRGTTPKPSTNAAEFERAEDLIGEVDAMPADAMVKRVGDPDVQAALETVAAANANGRRDATTAELDEHNSVMDAMLETPLSEREA